MIAVHRDWSPSINLGDNSARKDIEAGFARFCQVIEGMDVVEKLYGGNGEHSDGGMRAGHQDQMFERGNARLDREYPKLDRLIRATIIKSTERAKPPPQLLLPSNKR